MHYQKHFFKDIHALNTLSSLKGTIKSQKMMYLSLQIIDSKSFWWQYKDRLIASCLNSDKKLCKF